MRVFGAIIFLLLAGGCAPRAAAPALVEAITETTTWEETTVKSGQTLSELAALWELPQPDQFVTAVPRAAQLSLRPGEKIRVHRSLGPIAQLTAVEMPVDSRTSLFLRWHNQQWVAESVTRDFAEHLRQFGGQVATTLWESAAHAGMDVQLLIRLSEVFACVIDFSREIRAGDEWRLVATEYVSHGKHLGWKDIRIAEFRRGPQLFQAFGYEDPETKRKGFFTATGESLEKLFLKSPIKFGRISSRFTHKRFHPILQVNRPHLGVDYAAPTGTPIMVVGDGVVEFAAFSGGGGRIIKVRHNATFTTAYKHLSRFAAGLHTGKRVHQGDVIGFVGTTGLSTGPHLHFEFLKNGTFVDPQGLSFPAAVPLKAAEKARFQTSIASLTTLLPGWPSTARAPMATRTLSSVNP